MFSMVHDHDAPLVHPFVLTPTSALIDTLQPFAFNNEGKYISTSNLFSVSSTTTEANITLSPRSEKRRPSGRSLYGYPETQLPNNKAPPMVVAATIRPPSSSSNPSSFSSAKKIDLEPSDEVISSNLASHPIENPAGKRASFLHAMKNLFSTSRQFNLISNSVSSRMDLDCPRPASMFLLDDTMCHERRYRRGFRQPLFRSRIRSQSADRFNMNDSKSFDGVYPCVRCVLYQKEVQTLKNRIAYLESRLFSSAKL
jgi:hypothetical protein